MADLAEHYPFLNGSPRLWTPETLPAPELPWEEFDRACQAADDARRDGDVWLIANAESDKQSAKLRLAALGCQLLLQAVDEIPEFVRQQLERVYGEDFGLIHQMARAADKRARAALEHVDALRLQVRELTRRLDSITPGIGAK